MDNKIPEFWDELVSSIPVCIELEKNWMKIRDEYLAYAEFGHDFIRRGDGTGKPMFAAPNMTINDGIYGTKWKWSSYIKETPDSVPDGERKLYDGNWDVILAGTKPKDNPRQWGDVTFIRKLLKWQTKKTLEEYLEYSQQKFATFNEIVNEFADEGQCSGAFFSMVKPGTSINAHFGVEELMRCHLSLINDPKCILTVGDKNRTWQEGKILAFKDGPPYMHSVKHNGDKDRLVLVFDFDMT